MKFILLMMMLMALVAIMWLTIMIMMIVLMIIMMRYMWMAMSTIIFMSMVMLVVMVMLMMIIRWVVGGRGRLMGKKPEVRFDWDLNPPTREEIEESERRAERKVERKRARWTSVHLAQVATLIAVIGALPYIALQLKAISASVGTMVGYLQQNGAIENVPIFADTALLVAVALVDASLVSELRERLPVRSPDYFVLDIAKDEYPAIQALIERHAPGAELEDAPMLRGRLVRLGGTPVEKVKAPPEAQWVLNGDRGLSYSDTVPRGSTVVSGEWWGKDYAGPPLVSFEADLAARLGLKVGDTVTVNVLGRNITARIANLREVKWESLAINFVMVFSPNTLEAAPYNLLARSRCRPAPRGRRKPMLCASWAAPTPR